MPTSPNRPARAVRRRSLPGTGWLLYLAGLVGVVRNVEEALDEAGAETAIVDPSTRAEGGDLNPKAVFWTGVGLLLFVWAVAVGMYPIFQFFKYDRTGGRNPAVVIPAVPPLPPQPRLEFEPKASLAAVRKSEEAALTSYRWVDRARGVITIPIDRAIQIIAQRGIPPSPAGGKQYYNPEAGSRLTGFEGKVEPRPR